MNVARVPGITYYYVANRMRARCTLSTRARHRVGRVTRLD